MAYNTMFGRPLIKEMEMVTVIYFLTIKFPTPTGIGFIKGDMEKTREC